jgi:hypothetical protein
MKPLLLVASLLLAAPATAQSFYPNLFGNRFCELRRMGIDATQARDAAMSESWSNSRPVTYVTYQGKQVSLDVLDAARYVVNNCPELSK